MDSKMKELNKLINTIDFEALWDKFIKFKYAIYDDKHFYLNDDTGLGLDIVKDKSCYVGNLDERFVGNTAININDNYIAIVGIKTINNIEDNIKLASLIIHEMFHCFQYTKGEKRFPNELVGIDYPITNENVYYRMQERKHLLEACLEINRDKKIELLSLYFSIRSKREKLMGSIIDYEKATESTEGTAVYVEYKALTQMITTNNTSILDEYIKGFTDINENNLKIRHSSYNQGLLLGLIADELIPSWMIKFDNCEIYLSDFIKKELKMENVDIRCEYRQIAEIEHCVANRNKQISTVFDEFDSKSKGNIMVDGFMLTGFDPMNIVKSGNEVIHRSFLRVKIDDSEQILKGPVKTLIGETLFDIKRIEW